LPTATATATPTPVPYQITEYPLPSGQSLPNAITVGSDHNIWFTENAGRIGVMTTSGSVKAEYLVPSGSLNMAGMTLGPDGNVWFAEQDKDKIGVVHTSPIQVQEASVSCNQPPCNPIKIISGPGGKLWFSEYSQTVGTLTPGLSQAAYSVPTGALYGLVKAPDGNVYVDAEDCRFWKVTPNGVVSNIVLAPTSPNPTGCSNMTIGPDNNIWICEVDTGNAIARLTLGAGGTATLKQFALKTALSGPLGIVSGPDGALWFAESGTGVDRIGHITTSGSITEYQLKANSTPAYLTSGPDGRIWFTEYYGNKIGAIVP
jgi:virginiamycin B lyase